MLFPIHLVYFEEVTAIYYNRATQECFSCESSQEAFLVAEVFGSGKRERKHFDRAVTSGYVWTRPVGKAFNVTTMHNNSVI